MCTLESPNWTIHNKSARYKWFLDTSSPFDMYTQGGSVYNWEFILFVEDTDDDGTGDEESSPSCKINKFLVEEFNQNTDCLLERR